MSTTTALRDHLAELTEATAEMLLETCYVACVQNAYVRAANDRAEFSPFISDSSIKAADKRSTGTKP